MPTLYVVATPIGNLEDITLRALRVLREVRLIAAEDTRKARSLLAHHEIATPVTSCFDANERQKLEAILAVLTEGDVALISEAGTPGISDPGYPLIRAAIERGVVVVPVPGPSAHVAALVSSGLPTDRFLFLGFLPRKASERAALLQDVAAAEMTLVCYEAPHRLAATLSALCETLGDRPVALCRELTKLHEEIWRGTLAEAIELLESQEPRGEYTLVIGGRPKDAEKWSEDDVRAALQRHLDEGLSRSQAARQVAAISGWARREVYELGERNTAPSRNAAQSSATS